MMDAGSKTTIGVNELLELRDTDRQARSYAFLYAEFKKTEISKNPARDALDCLIPFIANQLKEFQGKQVVLDALQAGLRSSFGFNIPIYALDQILPVLKNRGLVEYRSNVKAYFGTPIDDSYDLARAEIDTNFGELSAQLEASAVSLGFEKTPPSGSWENALIAFLRGTSERREIKILNIKGAIVDPVKIETAAVGAFIQRLYDSHDGRFDKILSIYMGILVEEFISAVAEIGDISLDKPVNVFYDTAVLLRLLGCSGRIHRTATEELNRYLQDLGFNVFYTSGNEAEVANILNTIIHVKDSGGELEGETADAIAAGDVNITQIRMLQNTFAERLAGMNVFPGDDLERSVQANAQHQIDERAFGEYLKTKAREGGRGYGQQNRENDAGYLALVMRLRKRVLTRDLSACGYVFVTSNKFLATFSRRFLIEQNTIKPQHCPPMLSVGQIATIAWLMKDHVLAPEKAGRELLSNCYAAFRPDQEWFKNFRRGIEEVTGNIDTFAADPKNFLTLKAARRIAQEESFGESAVVRELNMVEILSRAEASAAEQSLAAAEDAKRELEAAEQIHATRLQELQDQWAVEGAAAERESATKLEVAREEARKEALSEANQQRKSIAEDRAARIVFALKIVLIVLFVAMSIISAGINSSGPRYVVSWSATAILFVLSVASFADFIGLKYMQSAFERLKRYIAIRIY